MKTILVTLVTFASLFAILIPLDAKNQQAQEAERVEFGRQVAEYESKVARGEAPALAAPKYPTSAEVAAYWKARGGYEMAKK